MPPRFREKKFYSFSAMRFCLFAIALFALDGQATEAPATSRPASEERAKLLSERFDEIRDAQAFPAACKAEFTTLTGEPEFALADPKEPYQATDAVALGPRLPWRRLIFGGVSRDRCVIYYQIGGFVTTYAVVVIDISNEHTPVLVWGGIDGGNIGDFPTLISQIVHGAFRQGDRRHW